MSDELLQLENMSVLDKMSDMDLKAFLGDFKMCVGEESISPERLNQIGYDFFKKPYDRMLLSSTVMLPHNERERRDKHLSDMNKIRVQVRRRVKTIAIESEAGDISGAKILDNIITDIDKKLIVTPSEESDKKPRRKQNEKIKQSINICLDTVTEFMKYPEYIKDVGIETHIVNLEKEAMAAFNAQDEIDRILADNKQKSMRIIRPEVIIGYRFVIGQINNILIMDSDTADDLKCLAKVLNEKIRWHKTRYASARGRFLSDGTKDSYYTLPKPRTRRLPSITPLVNLSKNPSEQPVESERYPNARVWTNMVDVDDFKLGDICFVILENGEKSYYEMIDESNFNINPSGEEGYLGWKPV